MADNKTTQTTVFKADISQFKNAISEAERSLKLARSEFEVAAAKADKLGDATAKLAAQEDLLRASISAAEQKIAAYKGQIAALNEATEKNRAKLKELADTYEKVVAEQGASSDEAKKLKKAMEDLKKEVSGNDAQIVKLTTTMNRTQAEIYKADKAMSDLKNSMNDTADKTKEAEKETKELASAEKKLEAQQNSLNSAIQKGVAALGAFASKAATFGISAIKTGIDQAIKGFTAYTAAAGAAATATVALSKSAADYVGDIKKEALITGLSQQQVQLYKEAADIIDVSYETISGSMSKLVKSMAAAQTTDKGPNALAEAFQSLGVAVRDSNGELRDSEDVFSEAIKALGKISNETERDALAMQIFGKSAQDLNPLILGGVDALEALSDELKQSGILLSDEAIENIDQLGDGFDMLKIKSGGAGRAIVAVFAGELRGLLDTVSNALPSLGGIVAKLFSGEDVGAELDVAVTQLGNTLLNKIEKSAPKLLGGFNKILSSLFYSVARNIPAFMSSIGQPMLDGFVNLIQMLITSLPLLINNLRDSVIPAVLSAAVSLVTTLTEALPTMVPLVVDAALQLLMGLVDAIGLVIPPLLAQLPMIIQTIADALIAAAPTILQTGFQVLMSLIDGLIQAIPILIDFIYVTLIPIIVDTLLNKNNLKQLINAAIQLIMAIIKGFYQAVPAIIAAIPEIMASLIEAIFEIDWLGVGWEIIKSIFDGMINGVKSLGRGVVDAIKGLFGGKSDIEIGVTDKGLALPASNLPTSLSNQSIVNNSTNVTYNQYITSPKALDAKTIYRQSKTLINNFAG